MSWQRMRQDLCSQYPYEGQFVDCKVEEKSDESREANEAMFYPEGDPKQVIWDNEFARDLSGLNC